MTRFALLIWAYEQTGLATTLALLGFFSWVPLILLSPVAGVWVDKVNRRLVMIWADIGAGLATVFLVLLYFGGSLRVGHLFLLAVAAGLFEAFQLPAFAAATSTLLGKEQYARANGMRVLAQNSSLIFAPLVGGALLAVTSLGTVMLVDLATFAVGVVTLLLVRIPDPRPTQSDAGELSFGRQLTFGLRYLRRRRGLLGLAWLFFGINLLATITYFSVLPALILARTGGDELALGAVQATLGAAGVVGALVVSVVGLPRGKIHIILLGCALSFFLGDLLFAVGRTRSTWIAAAFIASLFIPFISTANQTIWQIKVDPALQGRVFSVRTGDPKRFIPGRFSSRRPPGRQNLRTGDAARRCACRNLWLACRHRSRCGDWVDVCLYRNSGMYDEPSRISGSRHTPRRNGSARPRG